MKRGPQELTKNAVSVSLSPAELGFRLRYTPSLQPARYCHKMGLGLDALPSEVVALLLTHCSRERLGTIACTCRELLFACRREADRLLRHLWPVPQLMALNGGAVHMDKPSWLCALGSFHLLNANCGNSPSVKWHDEWNDDRAEVEALCETSDLAKLPLNLEMLMRYSSCKFAWVLELRELGWPYADAHAFAILATW